MKININVIFSSVGLCTISNDYSYSCLMILYLNY